MTERTCSLEDCDGDWYCRGRCRKHYMRWWKANKSKVRKKASKPPEVRFWEKVGRSGDDECWEWGAATAKGYGNFWTGDKFLVAHRFAYELLVGPIPEGLTIDHLCRNRLCVNPAHLEPVTLAENIRREVDARPVATHCQRGHEFTPENTKHHANGGRQCRTCLNRASRKRHAETRG